MTNSIIMGIIGGVVFGIIIGLIIGSSRRASHSAEASRDKQDNDYINDTEKKKKGNLAKLRDYLNSQTDDKLSNEEVRKLLNISDATACRYLDDLEKEGLIVQVGTDGPKVYYKKN